MSAFVWFLLAGAGAMMFGSLSGEALAAGTVNQLAGTLSVRKADGSTRILSQRSEVGSGDTLSTQQDSYAQIRFSDGAQITLKPNTSVKIENFVFSEAEPQRDSFLFSLVKGGLRAVTGLIGKRGDSDAFKLDTATATIGIRGTSFGADDCTGASAGQGPCQGLQAAVYVSVTDGEIIATNAGGTVSFLAGQFGMIDSRDARPRFLSTDPGLQFTPPVNFIASITAGTAVNQGRSLECVVRR